jgi:hypothetical protein
LFYMAMPSEHGKCRVKAIEVVCHCHSSVWLYLLSTLFLFRVDYIL